MATNAELLVSPVASRLRVLDVDWQSVNGYAAAARVRGDAPALRLADLSQVARAGFKGRGTCAWLARQGLALPAVPNQTAWDDTGCLVARLGQEDVLVIGTLRSASARPQDLEARWQTDAGNGLRDIGFPTPKQSSHALFYLGGETAAALLAGLCAVDLRPRAFAANALAQTMAAGIVATFLRYDRGAIPAYLMLVDTSYAAYFWDALVDAMSTQAGGIVGFEQLG